MRRFLGVLLMTGAAGCGEAATMTVPNVAAPVMLGPVRQVGGARYEGREPSVGSVEGEAFDFASASKDAKTGVTHATVISANGDEVSSTIRHFTDEHVERDTRVDAIDAGAYFFFLSGFAVQQRWVGLKGRVIEVAHAK